MVDLHWRVNKTPQFAALTQRGFPGYVTSGDEISRQIGGIISDNLQSCSSMDFVRCALHDFSRVVAAVTDPASVKRYLDGVGLPSELLEIKPARRPPQLELEHPVPQDLIHQFCIVEYCSPWTGVGVPCINGVGRC